MAQPEEASRHLFAGHRHEVDASHGYAFVVACGTNHSLLLHHGYLIPLRFGHPPMVVTYRKQIGGVGYVLFLMQRAERGG